MNNELIIERHSAVARLTVNRPAVRNALNIALTQRIALALRDLSRDRSLRVFASTPSSPSANRNSQVNKLGRIFARGDCGNEGERCDRGSVKVNAVSDDQ
jgi:1,4-dihydroxy-2-naphthoyl-CoA synthase